MKGDLGSLFWIVIVVLGIAGKFLDKRGPRQPPVARTGRPGQPTMRPPGQPKPPLPANRSSQVNPGKSAAVQLRRAVDEPEDGEGVSLENVKATVHNWEEARAQSEKAPEPILQPIPIQQAVVWAEVLGKPVSLRGRRR